MNNRVIRFLTSLLALLVVVGFLPINVQAVDPAIKTIISAGDIQSPLQDQASIIQKPDSPDTQGWITGVPVQPMTMNCLHGYTEVLGSFYVGYWGEWPTLPRVGEVFYTMGMWAISGNPCGGGAYVSMEYFLPEGVQLAISAEVPVRCFHDYYLENKPSVEVSAADGCPQQPGQGINGGMTFNPPWQQASWPTATGTGWRVLVPVVATKPLNGIDGNPCNVCLQAAFWAIDGSSSPTVWPKAPMSIPANTPYIEYPNPSATSLTSTSAHITAYAYHFYQAGQLWVDFGTSTNYNLHDGPHAIDGSRYLSVLQQDWTELTPSTTYHWRLRFVSQSGQTYVGPDQTFTTLASQEPVNYHLTVEPLTGGTVAANPTGPTYPQGTTVQLTATPTTGWTFSGWTVDGAAAGTTNPLSLVMNSDHTVKANFSPIMHSLTLNTTAGGQASTIPGGTTFTHGSTVQFQATPDAGFQFVGWEINGAVVSTNPQWSLVMDRDYAVLAKFAPANQVVVQINAVPGGQVTIDPVADSYAPGTTVTLTAQPNANYRFSHWIINGSNAGSDNPLSLVLNSNQTIEPQFRLEATHQLYLPFLR